MIDNESAARLYEDNADRLYRFCYRLCGDRADAEDLAADAFVAAFRDRDCTVAKLYGIALNKWRMMSRSRAVRRRLGLFLSGARQAPPEDRLALDEAIDGLPAKIREAFILVKVEGFTHAEAAAILARPLGTVQSQVFAACECLRKDLSDTSQGLGLASGPARENGK